MIPLVFPARNLPVFESNTTEISAVVLVIFGSTTSLVAVVCLIHRTGMTLTPHSPPLPSPTLPYPTLSPDKRVHQERAYVTGLAAANHAMDALPGDGGRRAPVLQTEPDEPQVLFVVLAP